MIFTDFAPRYRDAGIHVMPVRGKAAFLDKWSQYCREPADDETFETWLRQYGHCNIGIPLGPASGLVAVDVDTDVPAYLEVIQSILPDPVWVRVGSKGFASVYRFEGHAGAQLFAKNDLQKGTPILELLGDGRQIVAPPSIHPKTQRPYVANVELYDVMDKVGSLPRDFMERVAKAFAQAGIEVSPTSSGGAGDRIRKTLRLADHVPAGARDIAMTKIAGQLAVEVRRGETTFVDALAVIDQWNLNSIERRQGDEIDPNKGMENLAKFLLKDVAAGSSLPEGWDVGLDVAVRAAYGLDQISEGQIRKSLDTISSTYRVAAVDNENSLENIQLLLADLARSDRPDSLEELRLLKEAAVHSNKVFTVAELKRELRRLRAERSGGENGEGDVQHHHKVAEAMLCVLDAIEPAPYEDGSLWEWNGEKYCRWDLNGLVPEIGQRFGGDDLVKKASDYREIARLVLGIAENQVKAGERPGLPRQPVINFRNGVLDETLTLHPHQKEFGCRSMLDVNYDAGKGCPRFLSLLNDFWGTEADGADKITALRQAIAVTLFGVAPRYERAFCLSGDGKNGKSTILKIVQGLMPDNLSSSLSLEDFDSRFGPVSLDGKLINIGQEIEENKVINDKKLKEIVSGNEIEVEQKGQPRYKLRPIAAQWFGTNNVPRVNETSQGLQRRLLMFEFRREFTKEETQRDIDKLILSEEKEGIIAWAVQAIMGLEEYTLPASHDRLMHTFVVRNNTILGWLMNWVENGRIIFDKTAPFATEETTYQLYKNWCQQASTAPARLDRYQREMMRASRKYDFEIVDPDVSKGQVSGYRGLKFVAKRL